MLVEPFCCRDDWIRTSDHTPPQTVIIIMIIALIYNDILKSSCLWLTL